MNPRQRRASSLIELMILVAATSVMLVLTIGFIHRTLTWSKEVSALADELRINQQLTSLFLDDVSQTKNVTSLSDSEMKLTLQNGMLIHYQINRNELSRAQSNTTDGVTEKSNVSPIQERFTYLPDRILHFSRDETTNCIRLQLSQTAIDFEQPKALWMIEAYSDAKAVGGTP